MKSKWTYTHHATDADKPHRRRRRIDFQARRVRRRLIMQLLFLAAFMVAGMLLFIFLMARFTG